MSAIIDTLPDPADPLRSDHPMSSGPAMFARRVGPLPAAEEPPAYWQTLRRRTAPLSPVVLRDSLRMADAMLILVAAPLLSSTVLSAATMRASMRQDDALLMLAGGIAIALLNYWQQYKPVALRRPARFLVSAMLAGSAGSLVALCVSLLLGTPPQAMVPALAVWLFLSTGLLAMLRILLIPILRSFAGGGLLTHHVGIVGLNRVSRRFIEHARRSAEDGLHLYGVYSEERSVPPALHAGLVVRGRISDLVHEIRCGWIDTVVIALPAASAPLAAQICKQLESCAADILVLPDHEGLALNLSSPLAIPRLIPFAERPLKDWQAVRKRAFDILAGSALLLLMTPLFLLVATLIRSESPGPVLFRQRRIGFNNMEFMIYKFRTMYHDTADPDCRRQTSRDDQRVTRVGKWLRRLSIDELPQLLNVLKGDMSLVGPRPHSPNTRAGALPLDVATAHYPHRHRVRPGITGWAQVNGFRGEIRTAEHIRRRVDHDLHYIANWSLLFDLRILGLTAVKEVFSGRAY